ncbi:MAG: hypothetical protein ACKOFP_13810 [Actinomycetota bacterium]
MRTGWLLLAPVLLMAACGQGVVIDSGVRTDYSSASLQPGDDL